jgi:hypothetical protein
MLVTDHERVMPICRPAVVAFCMDILRNEGPTAFYKGAGIVCMTLWCGAPTASLCADGYIWQNVLLCMLVCRLHSKLCPIGKFQHRAVAQL